MGGLESVDLGFSGIRLEIKEKGGAKVLLDGSIKGRARPGRMLAVMGPSGAGEHTNQKYIMAMNFRCCH